MATPTTIMLPRARYETILRQALAVREQADALLSALHAEVPADVTDPRAVMDGKPATFGSGSRTLTTPET